MEAASPGEVTALPGQLRLGRKEALDRLSRLHPQQAKAWLRSELSEGRRP